MKNGERIDKEPGTGAKRTYTGHMLETDDGLYYCHARWYDAGTGRFIQADSVLDGLNRYTYCGNNPVNFSDPTGTKKSAEQKAAEKAEKQAAKQAKKEAKAAEKAAKAAEKQAKKEAREAERAARAAENPEKAGAQIIGAISDFISQYQKMKDENIIGNDHYNHAMANSRATQRGKYGKMTAQFLSFVREASDVLRKGDSDKDVREDNIANRYGREIQPGESPEQYNAQFDTRQGGHRADLTGKASEETPRNVSDFLNSYFTRDEYEK